MTQNGKRTKRRAKEKDQKVRTRMVAVCMVHVHNMPVDELRIS